MIELPEAVVLARQMAQELSGKVIATAIRGSVPHKFAFYSGEPEWYAQTLKGKAVGATGVLGGMVLIAAEPGYNVVLGCGGERILYHPSADQAPAKHHFLLTFTDGSALSVVVSGWGTALLLDQRTQAEHPFLRDAQDRLTPVGDAFTWERFEALFADLPTGDARAVKFFLISRPGLSGMGNGYLQDILFRAHIHPRRRAVDLSEAEREALYRATVETYAQAIAADGRDTERDLYDRPGRYVPILDKRANGRPCPRCGTAIEKISAALGYCLLHARGTRSSGEASPSWAVPATYARSASRCSRRPARRVPITSTPVRE